MAGIGIEDSDVRREGNACGGLVEERKVQSWWNPLLEKICIRNLGLLAVLHDVVVD